MYSAYPIRAALSRIRTTAFANAGPGYCVVLIVVQFPRALVKHSVSASTLALSRGIPCAINTTIGNPGNIHVKGRRSCCLQNTEERRKRVVTANQFEITQFSKLCPSRVISLAVSGCSNKRARYPTPESYMIHLLVSLASLMLKQNNGVRQRAWRPKKGLDQPRLPLFS